MPRILFRKKLITLSKIFSLLGVCYVLFFLYTILITPNNPPITDNQPKTSKNPEPEYAVSAEKAVFEGKNKDLIPYVINAEKAVKISDNLYNLEDINVLSSYKNKNYNIVSKEGHFDHINQKITLLGKTQVSFNELILSANNIYINLATDEIIGDSGVKLNYINSESSLDFKIHSDKLIVNKVQNEAYCEGSVVVRFEDMIITTDKLEIKYKKNNTNRNKIDQIIIPHKLKAIRAESGEILTASNAVYNFAQSKLILYKVKLMQKNDIIVTSKLIYYDKLRQIQSK